MIPLFEPHFSGNEWLYVKECLDSGWVSSAGKKIEEFEQVIARYTGSPFAIATVNGTAALHLALLACGVKPGDRVLIPNLTFVATANAVLYTGAIPVLVDVDPFTWQMDARLVEEWLQKQTGAIPSALIVTHALGNMGEIEKFAEICHHYGITLIEDAAEALGTRKNKNHAGTFGKVAVLSFNGNKIITTGGGGMLLTGDATLARKLRHLSTQAKADPDEYFHDEVGYNYRLPNILAALGLGQMEQLDRFLEKKRADAELYYSLLTDQPEVTGFQETLPGVIPNHWLFTVKLKEKISARQRLAAANIQSRSLWVPLHQLPAYQNCEYITTYNEAGNLYQTCLSLPGSVSLQETQIREICEIIINP
ncbi:MAG: aminotransferase class I/II-fold pyridoxal phosphate-dependent enzyme [Bacteroidia bacterium]|nr:aminotransferase class I/II-fold pyridoxal phosphate-dependent enzyme [Bacteroidia bacterium]